VIFLPGEYVEVGHAKLNTGDVILYGREPHLIVRKDHLGAGPKLRMQNLSSRKVLEIFPKSYTRLKRLRAPRKHQDGKVWTMACGDVVLYPATRSAPPEVAIRHIHGWYSSGGSPVVRADVHIFKALTSNTALAVRNSHLLNAVPIRRPHRIGTVAAVRSLKVREPTAWVCVGRNLWRSTSGVEASDLMIEFELQRGMYALLYEPDA
jgi:hypothetical protein